MFPGGGEDLVVTQRFAISADGTRVPYFLVSHRDSTSPGPTLLDGYGAFRVAQLPGYHGPMGRVWLSRGGSYALANIRGGGEYGRGKHQVKTPGGRGVDRAVATAGRLISRA